MIGIRTTPHFAARCLHHQSGTPSPNITHLPLVALEELLPLALQEVTLPAGGPCVGPVHWEEAGAALVIHLERLRVRTGRGFLLVAFPLVSPELGATSVVVAAAVPRRLDPGMVLAFERPPRGPSAVIDRWGDALVALCIDGLRLLLDVWVGDAVPAAIAADTDGLSIRAEARPPSFNLDLRTAPTGR